MNKKKAKAQPNQAEIRRRELDIGELQQVYGGARNSGTKDEK